MYKAVCPVMILMLNGFYLKNNTTIRYFEFDPCVSNDPCCDDVWVYMQFYTQKGGIQ